MFIFKVSSETKIQGFPLEISFFLNVYVVLHLHRRRKYVEVVAAAEGAAAAVAAVVAEAVAAAAAC
jgi:hypothetical protein